jgi:hypothetical protein
MTSGKLTIKEEMRAVDTKDRRWYDSLSDEERAAYDKQLWIQMRYVSSVKSSIKDFEEHYLEWTNELVNTHFNTLRHHPQLQFQLMQALGLGKSQFHQWIAPGKRGTENKVFKFFADMYPSMNDEEIEILLSQYTEAEVIDLLEETGMKKSDIKKLLK